MDSLTLDLKSTRLTDEQFFELCSANRDLRFERSAEGELIIMAPVTGMSGYRNAELTAQLESPNGVRKSLRFFYRVQAS
jgi:Uma2 family endonuclease